MFQVKSFTFNPFQENSYLIYDETKECAIVDPGMLTEQENNHLVVAIDQLGLKPVLLLQTHLHLDHVFGMGFVAEKYGLQPIAHPDDEFLLAQTVEYSRQFGVELKAQPPSLGGYLNDGDIVSFGNTKLKVIHVPGHSPGGIVFYNEEAKVMIAGDVLFQGSVGRSDLPGGSYEDLIHGIQTRLMIYPDEVKVYPGHGPATTIGNERVSNPFL